MDLFRLSSLMARLTWGVSRIGPHPMVGERCRHTAGGTVFDVYRHRRRNTATWIAIPGMTINGGRDGRLVGFARALARSGVTCVVPTLEGLAGCRWDVRDLDELSHVVMQAADESGQPVGLVGFSFGGSYMLRVAAREEVAGCVGRVITFGAYHDLSAIFEGYLPSMRGGLRDDSELEDTLYRRLAVLYGRGDRSLLPREAWGELESLLKGYCCDFSFEEKRRFFNLHLKNLDLSWMVQELIDKVDCRSLSPAGSLSGLRCPVTLIHDQNDTAVPPVHAHALFSELQRDAGAYAHKLVLTTLLSHVTPTNPLNVREIVKLARALSPIVGGFSN